MQLGRIQTLHIHSFKPSGAVLNGDLLLPKRYVPEGAKIGDAVEVFVHRDSEDRMVATTKRPKVQVGEFAYLSVTDISPVGAFLDWGMDKDLFLPYKEQLRKLKVHEGVLIYCYVDQSNRIAATMRVKDHFPKPAGLRENDWVDGTVYATNPEIGAFVLVEQKYNGLISRDDMVGALIPGQKLNLRVERIKPDGKIDLSMRSRAHERMDKDAETIVRMLEANHGYLRVNDHSDPEDIRQLFQMSKAQFKRSVGRLLKKGQIEFADGGIRMKHEERGRATRARRPKRGDRT